MIGTAAATLGVGLLGAGASMWGANKAANAQKDAANQAAAVQAKGQADALAFQKEVYDTQKTNFGDTKGYLSPFVNNGVNASNTLASGLGGDLSTFFNSPDYQFALKGGSQALDNSAAAKGGVLSGNQIRAQTEYGQGLATQNLQNYFQRLSGMAGQGIQAGGMLGQIGSGLGNGIVGSNTAANITGSNNQAQSIMGAGTAEASGYLGSVKGLNSGLGSLSLFNQMSKSSYGGGGSGFSLTNASGLY
jgi:hypothetical protein